MFLNAVILVLQETLEAALLLSILLVLVNTEAGKTHSFAWVGVAIVGGLLGAWGYAAATPVISLWFDYVGLEVVNALIQFCILLSLMLLCYGRFQNKRSQKVLGLMVLLTALGIIREASEIILYVNGILGQPENVYPVLLGGLTGAGIGISSGVILYYSLQLFEVRLAVRLAMVLLAFFAGNMAAQAVLLLTQADWLPYTIQVWNTAWLIPEYSVTGQLLYALIGYEANPSLLQVVLYVLAWSLVVLSPLFRQKSFHKPLQTGGENI